MNESSDIITVEDFKNYLNDLDDDEITIIKAYAEWCEPCKKVAPLVEDIMERMGDNIKLIKVDISKFRKLTKYLKIKAVPTFISFKGTDQMNFMTSGDPEKIKSFFRKVETYNL